MILVTRTRCPAAIATSRSRPEQIRVRTDELAVPTAEAITAVVVASSWRTRWIVALRVRRALAVAMARSPRSQSSTRGRSTSSGAEQFGVVADVARAKVAAVGWDTGVSLSGRTSFWQVGQDVGRAAGPLAGRSRRWWERSADEGRGSGEGALTRAIGRIWVAADTCTAAMLS